MKRLLWTALFASLSLAVLADKVILKDGRTYEGKILEETDAGVKIKTSKGSVTFPKDQIDKIERGMSMLEMLDEKLSALTPEEPAGYIEAAKWCVEQKTGDEATVKRLANIGMGLDPALCGKGNLILGDYQVARGDRAEAAEYYLRSFLADWKNEDARKKIEQFKDAVDERNTRMMTKLRDALSLAIDNRLADAIPALQTAKSAPGSNLISIYVRQHSSIDSLISDIRARVPCKTCSGKALLACPACGGAAKFTCSQCKGTGKKEIKQGTTIIRTETCPMCDGKKTTPCAKCKELRGKVKCGTCKGIIPPKPSALWDRAGLVAFRSAIDQRLQGNLPIEEQVGPKLPRLGSQIFDSEYVDDGKVFYQDGKWVPQSEKK